MTRGALFVAGTAAALLAVATPAMASTAQYCGAARGPTAEVAIQGAIDDAQASASGDGRYHCELADQPQIFEVFNDPNLGHFFRASVIMNCE